MPHGGPFQPQPFCDSVLLGGCQPPWHLVRGQQGWVQTTQEVSGESQEQFFDTAD